MMNTHSLRSILRRQNLVPLTAFFLLSLVVYFGFAVSGAHSQQNGMAPLAPDEREFENSIPEHLPIKVKLKNEQSFKNLKNKRWLRELEVEVKNTGSKPIYYVSLTIIMPDVLVNGQTYGTSVSYGRKELIYPEKSVEPGDVPIMPGESATLKVGDKSVKGYEHGRDELKERGDPKRIVCQVQVIKFGDGTSLRGPDGELTREESKGISLNIPKQKNGAEGCRSGPALSTMNVPSDLFIVSNSWQPASLLRADFLAPIEATAPAAAPDDCGCHSVFGCKWGRLELRNCDSCELPRQAVVFSGGCGNVGKCRRFMVLVEDCPAESDPTLKCT